MLPSKPSYWAPRIVTLKEIAVHRRRVEEVIAKPQLLGHTGSYELIFVTPPYYEVEYLPLVESLAASSLVGPGTVVVVEHPSSASLPDDVGALTRLRERNYGRTYVSIYAVAFEDE